MTSRTAVVIVITAFVVQTYGRSPLRPNISDLQFMPVTSPYTIGDEGNMNLSTIATSATVPALTFSTIRSTELTILSSAVTEQTTSKTVPTKSDPATTTTTEITTTLPTIIVTTKDTKCSCNPAVIKAAVHEAIVEENHWPTRSGCDTVCCMFCTAYYCPCLCPCRPTTISLLPPAPIIMTTTIPTTVTVTVTQPISTTKPATTVLGELTAVTPTPVCPCLKQALSRCYVCPCRPTCVAVSAQLCPCAVDLTRVVPCPSSGSDTHCGDIDYDCELPDCKSATLPLSPTTPEEPSSGKRAALSVLLFTAATVAACIASTI